MSSKRLHIKLSEACVFISRGITPAYIEEGGVCVLNQKCIRDQTVNVSLSRLTDPNKKKIPKEKFLQPFDILVNSTGQGTLGRVAQIKSVKVPATVDSHITIVRPDPDAIYPLYLGFLVRNLQPIIEQLAEGSTGQTELSRTKLGEITIEVPPVSEQRQVAETLAALDDRITLLYKTSATLEAIARALFKSWFVDFDPVRAKQEGREPDGMDKETAALFPDGLEESELGVIPKGWCYGVLTDLAQLNPESWSSKNHPSIITYIDLANAKCNEIDVMTEYAFSDAPSRARRVLRNGDTIVGTVRPGNRSFALIQHALPGLTGSTGFAVLRPKSEAYIEFVFFAATAMSSIDYLAHVADGGAYPAVRPEVVGNIRTVIPHPDVINKYHQIVEPLMSKLALNKEQIGDLAALRDLLLPRLISGQLRLPDDVSLMEDAA